MPMASNFVWFSLFYSWYSQHILVHVDEVVDLDVQKKKGKSFTEKLRREVWRKYIKIHD